MAATGAQIPHEDGGPDAPEGEPILGPLSTATPPAAKPRAKMSLRWRFYLLAALLLANGAAQLVPAIVYWDASVPVWMRLLVAIAALQLAYCAWMTLLPSRNTMWVATLASAGVSAVYGCVFAMAVVAPEGQADILAMNDLRPSAQLWAGAMTLINLALAFACGRLSGDWDESDSQLAAP